MNHGGSANTRDSRSSAKPAVGRGEAVVRGACGGGMFMSALLPPLARQVAVRGRPPIGPHRERRRRPLPPTAFVA